VESLQLLFSCCYCPVNITQLNCSATSSQPSLQNSTDLVITSRQGPPRKHHSSVVVCIFIAIGMCLPSCCPETTVVYSPHYIIMASITHQRYSCSGITLVIWGCLIQIWAETLAILTEVSCGFPKSLQTHATIILCLGCDHFLLNSFWFTIYLPLHH
jgi:hypothetical protein